MADDSHPVMLRDLSPHRTDGTLLPNQANTDVACVMATVHNWVEHVYKVFGLTLPTDPNKVALLGVREAHLEEAPAKKGVTEAQRVENAETGADAGTTKIDTEARVADTPKSQNTFNDLLYMVWTDDDAHHEQRVEVFKCTIDPGADETDTTGTPYLLEGKLYKGYASTHNPTKYPGSTALHLYTDSKMHIQVAREATKTTAIFDKTECALVRANPTTGAKTWEFCTLENNDSIHMHFSNDEIGANDTVGRWSTGCTVLRHERHSARYLVFANKCKGAANAQEIPYVVVSSAYMKTYTEWQAAIADKSVKPGDPAGVLKRDKLVSHPDVATQYIPSIATKDFVKNVLDFANKIGGSASDPAALKPLRGYLTNIGQKPEQLGAGAVNIASSVNRMCFTISV